MSSDYRGKTNYFGDRPMPIAGRVSDERERLTSMTMEEREWRAKWCKDQELAPDEPKYLPEMDRIMNNPIQRFYKTPLNWLFYTKLEPVIGPHAALFFRHVIPKGLLAWVIGCCIFYNLKYRQSSWERDSGWMFRWGKPTLLPGDPGYPNRDPVNYSDYYSKGFYERNVFLDMGVHGTSSYSK
ncbi:uncharacterized protein LOC129585822 [Paramacrobiotus metropolitanus]|uniref:uncharacterized protein LOC129585822 n=1 Tax=Paramacrobiotus metropolitanus TaxID=2943436 RepID=UPI0024459024|nr:uncharacterized protein LOC129585822 [Paramacrobiotus metropolitanus]